MPTSVRLSPDIEERLTRLSENTGRSKAYYIKEAIESEIDRLEYEQELLTVAADIRAGRRETMSSAEVRSYLDGLGD